MSIVFIALLFLSMLLAFRNERVTLLLVILCLPLYTLRGTLGPIPVTALEMLLCGASVITIGKRLSHIREVNWRAHAPALLIMVSWLFLSTLSMLLAQDIVAAAGLWKAYCIEPLLFALALFLTFRSEKEWRNVCVALVCSGSVIGLMSIVQYFTGYGIPDPWQAAPVRRSTAHYGYPNAVGLYLAPIAAISLGLAARKTTLLRVHRLALYWVFLCCLIGSILAHADGALAAIVVLVALLLIVRKRYIVFTLLTLMFCATVFIVPAARSIVTFQDTSGQVRIALWTGTLNLISHQPVTGSSLGQFPYAYEHYRLPSHIELLQYPHNVILDFWVEFGILGILWLIATLFYALWALFRLRRYPHIQATQTAAAFYLCAFVVYGIVDVTYFKNDLSLLFWIVLTMIYATLTTNTKRVQKH